MDKPLTNEQSAFAAEHHGLVYSFLKERGYSVDEYYDVAVFGYLKSVKDWYTRDKLRESYKFSTVAFMAMKSAMSRHFQSMNRRKRSGLVYSLNEKYDSRAVNQKGISDKALTAESIRQALAMLSPRQREVARLKAMGFNNREISERYFVTPECIRKDMENARDNIMRSSAYIPELLAA